MSVFSSIKIFPRHGDRSARVTWELPEAYADGTIDVAFSLTAAPDSWVLRTQEPVAASDGEFEDENFVIQAGVPIGYYKLLLTAGGEEFLSEPIGIFGEMNAREYGITHAINRREFMTMRATNGFPVFHFVTRASGKLARNVDSDTYDMTGEECAGTAEQSYDELFLGGYYPPMLTWVRPLANSRGSNKDREDGLGSSENVNMTALMLAWPQPARGHLLVDPVTDRRYIIDDVRMSAIRANVPALYTVTLAFLQTSHPAYRLDVPRDSRDWRQMQPYFMR